MKKSSLSLEKGVKKEMKTAIILFVLVLLIIAALFDIKYKGLFYKCLPKKIQTLLSGKEDRV